MSELIPIDDIEAEAGATDPGERVVPQTLRDDPDLGDGSLGRDGIEVSSWRLHTLREDELRGVTDYDGHDRHSRKARRAQQASRAARADERRASRRRRRVRVGLVLVLILCAIAAVAGTYGMELWGGRSVPNVEGLTQGHAIELLEERGFVVSVDTVPSDLLEGRVVDFSPAAGTRLEPGSEVSVVIGTSRVLPEVVGLPVDDAIARLEEAGATNVRTQTVVTLDEEEGLVRSVSPVEGSVFISTDEITLLVTQLPRVPDIMGMGEEDALEVLEEAQIPVEVTHERRSPDDRGKVIATLPEVGDRIDAGEQISIVVGDMLLDPLRLEDYFDVPMPQTQQFLTTEGFELKAATRTDDGHVVARFEDADHDARISFLQEPWTHVADEAKGIADVLGVDARVEGVRLEVEVKREEAKSDAKKAQSEGQATLDEDADDQPSTPAGLELLGLAAAPIDESTAAALIERCGFGEVLSSCTTASIELPPEVKRSGHTIYCCYGETQTHVWTVLVSASADGATEAQRIVATCVPKSYFSMQGSSEATGRVCDFVAYVDEYAD